MKKEQIRTDGVDENGEAYATIQREGEETMTCRVRPARDGEATPPGADLLHVKNTGSEGWVDVETLYRSSGGPPQVATPAYREGYDRIFGKKEVGLA